MTNIEKFVSDIEKAKKFARQNGVAGGGYNAVRGEIARLFENATSCPTDLPRSLLEYWENTYIYTSADLTVEP